MKSVYTISNNSDLKTTPQILDHVPDEEYQMQV